MPTLTKRPTVQQPGSPHIKYGRLTIILLPQVYIYRVQLPMRIDTLYPEWRVSLEHSKLAIWYPDFGFAVRNFDVNIIGVGQPFSPDNRIIHATVNIMVGIREVKNSETADEQKRLDITK